MQKVFFFRNVENLNELNIKTKSKSLRSQNSQSYTIIRTITLAENDYVKFCKKIRYNHSFLFKDIKNMKITADIWNCILIDNGDLGGILVMSDGYSHPLFTALQPS